MKTIAIANQKGGTAKTTTTAALGVLLSRAGLHVHMIDMDPQASLTQAFGCQDAEDRLYQAITSRSGLPVDELGPTLTLSPSTVEPGRAETELMTEADRERPIASPPNRMRGYPLHRLGTVRTVANSA